MQVTLTAQDSLSFFTLTPSPARMVEISLCVKS